MWAALGKLLTPIIEGILAMGFQALVDWFKKRRAINSANEASRAANAAVRSKLEQAQTPEEIDEAADAAARNGN